MPALPQRPPLPAHPRPIVIIGCGGIVQNAHLPAYRAARWQVAGVYDVDTRTAARVAARFAIGRVFASLGDALATPGVVFDIAVPADQLVAVLRALPRGAAVLMQKPMGRNLGEARRIVALCHRRQLVAAVNLQLRSSPNMIALRALIARGALGTIRDVEVRVNTLTPWRLWTFLEGIPRIEVLYHSIHYLDLIRSLLGEPRGVHCIALRDPELARYADTRSSILLAYPGTLRCTLSTNHQHALGPRHAMSELKIEGTRGAAVARMGVNLDYPKGRPDRLEVALDGRPWRSIALRGSWFPAAFLGPMASLQRHIAGEDRALPTSVTDALRTMALVEACYRSARSRATPIPH